MSNSSGTIKETGSVNYSVVFKQQNLNNTDITAEVVDDVFMVEVDNLLLNMYYNGAIQTPTAITPLGVAQYTLIRDEDLTPQQGGKLTIAVNVKKLSDTLWSTIGTTGTPRTIQTFIRCTGMQSGIGATFTLTIEEVV